MMERPTRAQAGVLRKLAEGRVLYRAIRHHGRKPVSVAYFFGNDATGGVSVGTVWALARRGWISSGEKLTITAAGRQAIRERG